MNDTNDTGALTTISTAEVAEHVERGDAFVLDLRRAAHGEQLYGAIRYDPKKLLDAARLVLPLPKSEGLIVIYDEDGTSSRLAEIAARLRRDGYARVRALAGGFAAWRSEGGRTEEATIEQPVPLVSEHRVER